MQYCLDGKSVSCVSVMKTRKFWSRASVLMEINVNSHWFDRLWQYNTQNLCDQLCVSSVTWTHIKAINTCSSVQKYTSLVRLRDETVKSRFIEFIFICVFIFAFSKLSPNLTLKRWPKTKRSRFNVISGEVPQTTDGAGHGIG